jgi:hypothetical protein
VPCRGDQPGRKLLNKRAEMLSVLIVQQFNTLRSPARPGCASVRTISFSRGKQSPCRSWRRNPRPEDLRAARRRKYRVLSRQAQHENGRRAISKSLILLVPGERIELPTNGLQNRCSTAELTRRTNRHFNGLGLYAACAETPLATILLPTGLLAMK